MGPGGIYRGWIANAARARARHWHRGVATGMAYFARDKGAASRRRLVGAPKGEDSPYLARTSILSVEALKVFLIAFQAFGWTS